MSEEKKGMAKITIEVEINEPLMEAVKECMPKMHWMKAKWKKGEERKKGEEGEEE
jgi:hypothetical protein